VNGLRDWFGAHTPIDAGRFPGADHDLRLAFFAAAAVLAWLLVRRGSALPGIGEWTAAETAQRALGHPDAVSVGDYHLKDLVVHFLTGRARGEDAEMLRLLEPWVGQRQRVVRLIELSGVGKLRFGPRLAPVDIRAI